MGNSLTTVIRGCSILLLVGALGASASAPKQHQYAKSADMAAPFDPTWDAVIDVFADRNWAITNMEKASGLITTDWMRLSSEDRFADCGGSGLASVVTREIRFNVLVRGKGPAATVTVNATFRELRSFDGREGYVDCESTGAVERLIHQLVDERLASRPPPPPPPAAPASAPAAPVPAAAAPPTAVDGTLGGKCYGNQTCNAGMRCDDILDQCVSE